MSVYIVLPVAFLIQKIQIMKLHLFFRKKINLNTRKSLKIWRFRCIVCKCAKENQFKDASMNFPNTNQFYHPFGE